MGIVVLPAEMGLLSMEHAPIFEAVLTKPLMFSPIATSSLFALSDVHF